MIYYFLAVSFGIFYLIPDRITDIAANIHDIYPVAEVYLTVVRSFKSFHFFIGRSAIAVNALEDIISSLCFKLKSYLFHFHGKPHAAADGVGPHISAPPIHYVMRQLFRYPKAYRNIL